MPLSYAIIIFIINIGYYHFAHSYTRGNWRNSNETSPLILAKSCHDMDILLWLTLMEEFVKAVILNNKEVKTSSITSVESHVMAFAAGYSRLNHEVVNVEKFWNNKIK